MDFVGARQLAHELYATGREPPGDAPAKQRGDERAFAGREDSCRHDRATRAIASPETAISIAPAKNALANSGSSTPPTPEIAKTMPAPTTTRSAKSSREAAILPHADPVDACGFHRPERRRVAVVEGERNRDRREDDGKRQERTAQEREPGLAALAERQKEQRVDHRERERAPRGTVALLLHEGGLQREADERDAEDEQAVDAVSRRGRRAPQILDRDGDVESEE